MKILDDIDYVLENDFKCNDSYFEESNERMHIPIKKDGCQLILYKFDKELGREYKGGLFPFFKKNKSVCKISDYILFAAKSGILYVLIIELKKGKESTMPQIKAATIFTKYIIDTVNRVRGTSYKPQIRFISIHKYKIRKKNIKEKGIKYINNHCNVTSVNFNVKLYLV